MNRNQALFPIAILLTCLAIGCDKQVATPVETPPIASGTVDLMIDFRDRDDIMVAIPCSADSTVLSIMQRAQNIGDLKFTSRGSADTAFLTAINGIKNEGGGGDNWVFRVNGKLGDRSIGTFPVNPQDEILWRFGVYNQEDD
jgi:hypothetical protein